MLEPVFQRLMMLTLMLTMITMTIMMRIINRAGGRMCTTTDNKYLSSIASGVSSAARIPQPGRHIDLIVDFIDDDIDIT